MISEVFWYKGWEKCFIDSSMKLELNTTWVYFILAEETQLVKIGKSTNPDCRLSTLKRLNADILTGKLLLNNNLITEGEAHTQFNSSLHHGEWYFLSEELYMFLNYFTKERKLNHFEKLFGTT